MKYCRKLLIIIAISILTGCSTMDNFFKENPAIADGIKLGVQTATILLAEQNPSYQDVFAAINQSVSAYQVEKGAAITAQELADIAINQLVQEVDNEQVRLVLQEQLADKLIAIATDIIDRPASGQDSEEKIEAAFVLLRAGKQLQ